MAAWDILSFHGKIKLNQLSTWDFPLLDFAKLMVDISAVVFDKKKLMPGGGYPFVWGLTISSKKAVPRFISILLLMTSYDSICYNCNMSILESAS